MVSFPTSKRTGRWARATFKIVLSYNGGSFDGWQKQPGLNTVQGFVERSLGKFVDEKKFGLLKDKGLPIEGCAIVAGRTDKGVTAFQQVCSFYTWRKDVKAQDIEEAINDTAPGKLRVISVSVVSRAFHPNFSAKWRRYLYIFPFIGRDEQSSQSKEDIEDTEYNVKDGGQRNEYGFYTLLRKILNCNMTMTTLKQELKRNQPGSVYTRLTNFYVNLKGSYYPTGCLRGILKRRETLAHQPSVLSSMLEQLKPHYLLMQRMEKVQKQCVLSWLLTASYARWFVFLLQHQ